MNILIIKHGSLGDLVLSIGAIKTLRNYFQNDKLILLTQSNYKKIFYDMPFVDLILEDNRENIIKSIINIIFIVKKNKIDLVFDLQNSSRTSCYNFFIKYFSSSKILSARKFSSFKYSQKEKGYQHITKNHADQLKLLGINQYLLPDIEWMGKKEITKDKYVVLIPGASISGRNKKWPIFKYAAISKFLISINLKVYLTGSNADLEDINEIIKICPGAYNKISDSKIRDFFSLCKSAVLIIGNDTGPSHIAGLTNRPLIWLANINNTTDSSYPLGKNVHKLTSKNIKNISIHEVISKIKELI